MSSIKFSIQPFDSSPLQDVGHIYQQSHQAKGLATQGGPDPYVKIKQFKKISLQSDLDFILAHQTIAPDQQKLQGFACFQKKDNEYEVHDVCTITPKGSGVGAAILNVLFQNAVENNISTIRLHATSASFGFYEQLFFENTEITDNGYVMVNNQVTETAELMNNVYRLPKI